MIDQCLLLDDGTYSIRYNNKSPCDPRQSDGFLFRNYSPFKRGGRTCIGAFKRSEEGKWVSDINIRYDCSTDADVRTLGAFDTRLRAIKELWDARREAFCEFG